MCWHFKITVFEHNHSIKLLAYINTQFTATRPQWFSVILSKLGLSSSVIVSNTQLCVKTREESVIQAKLMFMLIRKVINETVIRFPEVICFFVSLCFYSLLIAAWVIKKG